MKPRVGEDRLREILTNNTHETDQEKVDIAFDALVAIHSNSSKEAIIKDLRNTLKEIEERRPFLRHRPRIPLQVRQDLREAWEKASPAPWGVWASQPSVNVFHSHDEAKVVANIDTWSGRGVFDADAISLTRNHILPILEELESFEEQEKKRWRLIAKTTPSGKALFVCMSCGRESVAPDKTCPQPIVIATGGSAPAETLDCESAYKRRPR